MLIRGGMAPLRRTTHHPLALISVLTLLHCGGVAPTLRGEGAFPQLARLLYVDYSIQDGAPRATLLRSHTREMTVDFDSTAPSLDSDDGYDFIHVYYTMGDSTFHAQSLRDPRIINGDWREEHTGERKGQAFLRTKGVFTVNVPASATDLRVVARGPKHSRQQAYAQEKAAGVPIGSLIPTRTDIVSVVHIPRQHIWDSRSAVVQAQPTDAVFVTELSDMKGDPDLLKNLVLLPSGFQSDGESRSKYYAAAQTLIEFLRGALPVALSPSPWDRYLSVINYMVMWQPSEESGATFPDGKAGGKPGVGPITKNTNLDCSYGTDELRLLSCDYLKSKQLAAVSGANMDRTTSVAIVNEDTYGGSGGSRVGAVYLGAWEACEPCGPAFSNQCDCPEVLVDGVAYGWKMAAGNRFLQVMIHELGHADAKLADEYDYKRSEDGTPSEPNCSGTKTSPKWSHWMGLQLGVDLPSAICGFTNRFKPTTDLCLMNSEVSNEYCAVCAEGVIRRIYAETDQFAVPRCPRQFETMVITDEDADHYIMGTKLSGGFLRGGIMDTRDSKTLSIGAHVGHQGHQRADDAGTIPLRVDGGDIHHTWRSGSGNLPNSVGNRANPKNFYAVNGQKLGLGHHEVTLTIIDDTNFVADPDLQSQRERVATYRILVVSQANATYSHCSQAELEKGNGDNTCPLAHPVSGIKSSYCGICDPGRVCNETYPSRPFQVEANLDAALAGIEGVLFGVGGAAILGGLLIFAAAFFCLGHVLSKSVKEIIPFSTPLVWARGVMLVSSVLTMIISVTMGGISVYSYSKLTAVGKTLVLVVMLLFCVLWVIAFIGFTAAYFRSKALLAVNGVILFLCVAGLLTMTVFVLHYGNNPDSEGLRSTLETNWISQIKNNPKSMCSFQTTFKCSGFDASCHNKFHSQCPPECEVTNGQNPNPCYSKAQEHVAKWYKPLGMGSLLGSLAMTVGLVSNWALFCCIRQRKARIKMRMSHRGKGWANAETAELTKLRAVNILAQLTEQERESLKREFKKIDKDGSGSLTAKELQKFFKQALGQKLTEQESVEALRRLDANGDGQVDFDEFLHLYQSMEDATDKAKRELLEDKRLAHLEPAEVEKLYDHFREIDITCDGKIQILELKRFYRQVYNQDPTEEDLNAALTAVENDGSGNIDFAEFAMMFAGKLQL